MSSSALIWPSPFVSIEANAVPSASAPEVVSEPEAVVSAPSALSISLRLRVPSPLVSAVLMTFAATLALEGGASCAESNEARVFEVNWAALVLLVGWAAVEVVTVVESAPGRSCPVDGACGCRSMLRRPCASPPP